MSPEPVTRAKYQFGSFQRRLHPLGLGGVLTVLAFNTFLFAHEGRLPQPEASLTRQLAETSVSHKPSISEHVPASLLTRDSQPSRLVPGQSLPPDADGQLAEVEGEVTFASEQTQGLILELSSSSSRVRVELEDGSAAAPILLLHSRVRATGVCRLTMTPDGDYRVGALLVPKMDGVEVLEWSPLDWPRFATQSIHSLPSPDLPSLRDRIIHLRGKVSQLRKGRNWILGDSTGEILVEALQAPPRLGIDVEVLGRCGRRGTNLIVRGAAYREILPTQMPGTVAAPLTRVEQIKTLSLAEAQRGYPVEVRGVVTTVLHNGFLIQDGPWAVYVSNAATPERPRPAVGEFWQIEGATHSGFAPSITPTNMTRLGVGAMPEPLHPTWDQLINGSLDAQYIELQGVVVWSQASEMSLLTRSGKISIRMVEAPPRPLKTYEGALIRLRGCVIPVRDVRTMQVQVGRIELSNYLISIDDPPPADPFAGPYRELPELLKYNSRASAIERVWTRGQVIGGRNGEYFLSDGTNGLRFVPRTPVTLAPGDEVELVGFPGLGGPSPVIREAFVRGLGRAPLPSAHNLPEDAPLNWRYDATLVRLKAHLVSVSKRRSEQLLELRAGGHNFLGRLEGPVVHNNLIPGSLLELVGVYVGQGGPALWGREITTFEMLLNGPKAIQVLQQPSWWTLQRALWVLGATSLLALVFLGWVATLKREVHRQTEIIQQKVDREAVLEERTRIAREFHDTVQQQVAAVALQLQAARARLDQSPEFVRHVLRLAESMLRHAQAEARHSVWNLRAQALEGGSLEKALKTLASFAGNGATADVQVSVEGTPFPLPERIENHLLRVSQEAISNAVKHSGATRIHARLCYTAGSVQLNVRDDGKGFDAEAAPSGVKGHFGLLGMRERAEKMGGTLTVTTAPGRGTEIGLQVPLPAITCPPATSI